MKAIVTLYVCCLSLTLSACRKEKAPDNQLPPITQNGKNTFGCLINGKIWLPRGSFPLGDINPYVRYAPGYPEGDFFLQAYRIESGRKVELKIAGDSVDKPGVYPISNIGASGVAAIVSISSGCYYLPINNEARCNGTLEIIKMSDDIIAGTFSFTILKSGCETLNITDGRFDMKR
jgi:hypothetical protein